MAMSLLLNGSLSVAGLALVLRRTPPNPVSRIVHLASTLVAELQPSGRRHAPATLLLLSPRPAW